MGTYDYRFTVFTPAYNRAYILEKLYASLQRQSFRNFEWLVVDDGSTDDTAALLKKLQQEENFFPIRYLKKANGGKHTAINAGAEAARGELFMIVDSDDYLTENALEQADILEKSVPGDERQKFAGVCGQRGYDSQNPIGTTFDGDTLDITVLQRMENGITGDKAEIIYTDVMKKYPFPVFEGERFLTECVVWNRMAADGWWLRFSQDIMIVTHYLQDGLTSQGQQTLFEKNPRGYGLYLSQQSRYEHWPKERVKETCRDYYYQFRDRMTQKEMAQSLQISPVLFRCFISYMRFSQAIREKILKKET